MELTITNVNFFLTIISYICYVCIHHILKYINLIILFISKLSSPVMTENNLQWTQKLFTKLFGFDDLEDF